MTEAEAQAWIRERFGVSRETRLRLLAEIVSAASTEQNLIAASTLDSLWARHIVDSAQLLDFAKPRGDGAWLDIGTGAGFPGLVIACLRHHPITLCEPRRRRADFLASAIEQLDIVEHTRIACTKVEAMSGRVAIISARAVSSLTALFESAAHISDRRTLWLLPKGRGAREEVEAARKTWHGSFHVEQSLTQPESLIVVATAVTRK